jgi:hypothetical protein
MAENDRHAAGRNRYEVFEVLENDPKARPSLRFTCDRLADAIDLALDYLRLDDPLRSEISALEILKVGAVGREVVWTYNRSQVTDRRESLMSVWGFDPTRPWRLPRLPSRPGGPSR